MVNVIYTVLAVSFSSLNIDTLNIHVQHFSLSV